MMRRQRGHRLGVIGRPQHGLQRWATGNYARDATGSSGWCRYRCAAAAAALRQTSACCDVCSRQKRCSGIGTTAATTTTAAGAVAAVAESVSVLRPHATCAHAAGKGCRHVHCHVSVTTCQGSVRRHERQDTFPRPASAATSSSRQRQHRFSHLAVHGHHHDGATATARWRRRRTACRAIRHAVG